MNKEIVKQEKKLDPTVRWIQLNAKALSKVPKEVLEYFILYCKHVHLDPIKKEVYLVELGGSYVPITNYLVYQSRAIKSGKIERYWVNQFDIDKNGNQLPKDKWRSITYIKLKGIEAPFEWVLLFNEVSRPTPIWNKMPRQMFEKCSLANAFRKTLPEVIGELPYIAEEGWENSKDLEAIVEEMNLKEVKKDEM